MSTAITLPRAQIPIAGALAISPDWYRWARDMTQRIGGVTGLAEAFPVGAVFVSVSDTNPASMLGYGTWQAFGAGRVLVGVDASDADFDAPEATGGAKTVAAAGSNAGTTVDAHASHTHTYTDVVNHTHPVSQLSSAAGALTGFTVDTTMDTPLTATDITTGNPSGGVATGTTAGPDATLTHASHTHAFTGTATSVVQPFIAVYFWKRTA